MELPKELKEEIVKWLSKTLPYPKDIDVQESEIKITGICFTIKDCLLVEISEDSE